MPISQHFTGHLSSPWIPSSARGIGGGPRRFTEVVLNKQSLAPASWCAGSAIKRPCEPVPVTHAPGGHRPDAKRRVHRSAARLPAQPRPVPLAATNSSPGVCNVPTPPSRCISPPVCWRSITPPVAVAGSRGCTLAAYPGTRRRTSSTAAGFLTRSNAPLEAALSTRHQLHYHGSRQWITSLHITEARMYQPLCTRASARAHANAHAHARRSENFHRLETLLAQRRFKLIPMEILPHCAAVPLGVMVRGIMESLLDAEALEKLLQEYAPQQYTLELTIDALVSLLIQVSAGHRATVFAAYTADQASMPPTISTSYQALYAKLGRMDP